MDDKIVDNKIGNGTMLVSCYNCGESLLSGEMTKHLQSKECQEAGEKNRMEKNINNLKERVEELEGKEE